MNDRDSEKMAALLQMAGFSPAPAQEEAALIIYNTCCVRESAEDKVFGHLSALKSLKQAKPELIIAVCGCMTQQAETAAKFKDKLQYVSLVFGTMNRHRLPEFLCRIIDGEKQIVDIEEADGLPEIENVPVTTRSLPHKAGVNIMYGCDNFCSYCIVPYVRGREKSRPMADIIDECRALAEDGVREIMLLGQNVNSYGYNFSELLKAVCAIEQIVWVRFMTSHPKDFPDELLDTLRTQPKLCPHVHLPLQSGSTRVLADMNRHYTHEDFIALASKLKAIPGMHLTTDVIVAYPGETEDDFLDTLAVMQAVGFAGVFTFIYSPRTGTPAANRTDTIPRDVAAQRFDRLLATIHPIQQATHNQKVGQILHVMVDDHSHETGLYKGRTACYTLVHFLSEDKIQPGEIVPIHITVAKSFYVKGAAV
jgi:tRNA-2-methylthio-N6-dimethylallyladenosine synthase